jgi:hypothetical protein
LIHIELYKNKWDIHLLDIPLDSGKRFTSDSSVASKNPTIPSLVISI